MVIVKIKRMVKGAVLRGFWGIIPLLLVIACATGQRADGADPGIGEILRQAAGDIALKFPPPARIAIDGFEASPENLSEYLMAELAAALSGSGFEAVPRTSVEYIRRAAEGGEGLPALRFAPVSSRTPAERITGTQAGAGYVVSGHLESRGRRYQISLSVLDLEKPKTGLSLRYSLADSEEFRALAAEGELVSAFAGYGISEGSSPASPGGLLDKAMFFAGQGSQENAIEVYTGLLNDDQYALSSPGLYALAVFWRGYAWLCAGEPDRALEDYLRAVEMAPDNLAAYLCLGKLYADRFAYDEAIEAYTRVLMLDPRDASTYKIRGDIHELADDLDQAIADYTRAVKLEPRNALFYVSRGDAYAYQGGYTQALADYTQAVRLDPENAAAFRSRGKAYSDTGEQDKALDDYTQAISLDPAYAGCYNLRGILYVNRFDYDRAIADFSAANRLDPDNRVYSRNLQAAQNRKKGGG
jgi:tetratricopeptide (TPR) repeat protein